MGISPSRTGPGSVGTVVRAERVRVVRVGESGRGSRADSVVVEEPLTIHLEHAGTRAVLGSTMRTPGDDLELAVGLAVGEGIVRDRSTVAGVRHCTRSGGAPMDNEVTLTLASDARVDLTGLGRVRRPTSACGICGRDEIDDLLARVRPVAHDVRRVDAAVLAALPDRMAARQSLFRRTGGLHAAAGASAVGELLSVREDVGRHNAVDKVVGDTLLRDVTVDVLVVSGRAGFEIVQKAAMAGIPVVAAVSAPTSLAVQVARACDLTLAAFVRDGQLTLYAGEHRVSDGRTAAAR